MKCYYEQLGIPRDATDADIKTAYRKMALRWHPDKNPDSIDEAKERFQLIQQAYEVLSDPQERAWYDNHREQILRGKNSDYTENCLDVFEYFTSSCFRGYGDDEKGFYAVYREVFNKIAAEDAEFMDDEDDVEVIPSFGDAQSSYEDVVGPFYAYWQAYCTKKTYTWLCRYDVKEIRDRRILREIEKDMKKVTQKARKERNEEVRNLVSFVRKRDKRVQAYRKMLEERAELNRKKQEQNRLEQIRKRQKELQEMREQNKQNAQHNNDDYEAQLKQLEQTYGDDSDADDTEETDDDEEEDGDGEGDCGAENQEDESSVEEEFYVDNLYCIACNKMFKNERAYANHESSKKHREATERMRLEMQAEEEAFQQDNDEDDEDEDGEEFAGSETEDSEINKTEKTPSDNPQQKDETTTAPAADAEDEKANGELFESKKGKKSKKARKNAKQNQSQIQPTTDEQHEEMNAANFLAQAKITDSDDEDWNSSGKKAARKNKNKKQNKKATNDVEKNNVRKEEIKLEQKKAQNVATSTAQQKPATESPSSCDDEDDGYVDKVESKKKTPAKPKTKTAEPSTANSHVCVTCKANFPSKNKLFSHLKITNHGVYIPKTTTTNVAAAAAEGKSKKGKAKKK